MYNFEPIGTVRCNFIEKFGIPRQPGLSPSSEAIIEFPNNRFFEDSIKDLEGNSHIWVIFIFSSLKKKPDKAKIRPPRLGGNKYVGVFSSRSPYRPNPIGLSLVKFSHISYTKENIRLHISDHDLLNGTPVLDIKPYTNADTPNCEVTFSWQESEWCNLEVSFSEEAEKFLFKKIKHALSSKRPFWL